jgi:hypothetical protein
MKNLLAFVLAGACAQPAPACDLCSVYAAMEAQGGSGKDFFAGVAGQYTYFNTLQIDGHDVSNQGNQYLRSSISQVFAEYNFNDRIGVQFNLPVIYRSYGYQSQRGSELGIGDVSLLGNVQLYQTMTEEFTFNWTGLGGRKVPDRQHLAAQSGSAGFRAGHRRARFDAGIGLLRWAAGDRVLRAMEEAVCDRDDAICGAEPGGLRLPIRQ